MVSNLGAVGKCTGQRLGFTLSFDNFEDQIEEGNEGLTGSARAIHITKNELCGCVVCEDHHTTAARQLASQEHTTVKEMRNYVSPQRK